MRQGRRPGQNEECRRACSQWHSADTRVDRGRGTCQPTRQEGMLVDGITELALSSRLTKSGWRILFHAQRCPCCEALAVWLGPRRPSLEVQWPRRHNHVQVFRTENPQIWNRRLRGLPKSPPRIDQGGECPCRAELEKTGLYGPDH